MVTIPISLSLRTLVEIFFVSHENAVDGKAKNTTGRKPVPSMSSESMFDASFLCIACAALVMEGIDHLHRTVRALDARGMRNATPQRRTSPPPPPPHPWSFAMVFASHNTLGWPTATSIIILIRGLQR